MEEYEKDDLLEWANEMDAEDLSDFVEAIYQAYLEKREITIKCGKHTDIGRLKEFRMIYDEYYPDFDIEIGLETSMTKEGYPYLLLFSELTKNQIKKEGDMFHINTNDGADGYIIMS